VCGDVTMTSKVEPAGAYPECLRGFKLIHVIYLVSEIDLNVVADAAKHLQGAQTRVNKWQDGRRGTIALTRL
jgi:hypothetical protein